MAVRLVEWYNGTNSRITGEINPSCGLFVSSIK